MSMAQIGERLHGARESCRSRLDRAIENWRRRAYERQVLMTMSDAMLRDIGITRCDAMSEASKPFWRA